MTVSELSDKAGFKPVNLTEPDREITGAYCGDLLSYVMGRAKSGDAWITIMSNINVIAVASLSDVACVILAEGVSLEDEIIKTARDKEINILSSPVAAYETAAMISKLL